MKIDGVLTFVLIQSLSYYIIRIFLQRDGRILSHIFKSKVEGVDTRKTIVKIFNLSFQNSHRFHEEILAKFRSENCLQVYCFVI